MKKNHHHNERGNVIFYILIAIVLLASLTYAVTRNNRSSASNLTSEQARIAAQEIIDYGNSIAAAVQKLRLRGCTENQLSFEGAASAGINASAPPDKSCHVYDENGGSINTSYPYEYFESAVDIQGVGTSDGIASSADLFFVTRMVSSAPTGDMGYSLETAQKICEAINDLILGTPVVYNGFDITRVNYIGTFSFVYSTPTIPGALSGCVTENAGTYSYYQVLIAR